MWDSHAKEVMQLKMYGTAALVLVNDISPEWVKGLEELMIWKDLLMHKSIKLLIEEKEMH